MPFLEYNRLMIRITEQKNDSGVHNNIFQNYRSPWDVLSCNFIPEFLYIRITPTLSGFEFILTLPPSLPFLQTLPYNNTCFLSNSWPLLLLIINCMHICFHTHIPKYDHSVHMKLFVCIYSGMSIWNWTINWCVLEKTWALVFNITI